MLLDLTDIANTSDIDCLEDMKPHMPMVSGRTALLQRLARRLITPRGKFIFWPNFGTDLRRFLLTKTSPGAIAQAAKKECVKDEQVEQCLVTAQLTDSGRMLVLDIEIEDADGPFTFTLTIDDAALNLVRLQEEAI